MKAFEAIRSRRSVRTFDGTPLGEDDRQRILDLAGQADNPYGIPITWKILDAKESGLTSPVIIGTDTYIAGKMQRIPHAEEAFGYSFEKVVLFAESIGVGTTWIAGTMNRDAFEKAMDLSDGEFMPCVSPLGYPAAKMSLRESMMRRGVKADSRFDFGSLFFEGSFEKPLTREAAGKLADAFEAVRLAPSAVNRQPWRVVLCGNTAHFYEKRERGMAGAWDIQKIDMGIALSHFELAAAEIGVRAVFTLDKPDLGGTDNPLYIASFSLEP